MPSPEQVVHDSNAGQADSSMPGLQGVLDAWNSINDFVGNWQSSQSLYAQGLGDLVTGISADVGYAIPTH